MCVRMCACEHACLPEQVPEKSRKWDQIPWSCLKWMPVSELWPHD